MFNKTSVGGLLGSKDFIEKYQSIPGAVMVDVRTPAEYDAGHIASAINIDFYNQDLFMSEIWKLDPTKVYFVYCRSGSRSAHAVALMKQNSVNHIYELRGGIAFAPELLES